MKEQDVHCYFYYRNLFVLLLLRLGLYIYFIFLRSGDSHGDLLVNRRNSWLSKLSLWKRTEPVFVNVYGVQESILRKRFRQPMKPGRPVGSTNRVFVPARQAGNRFLGSLKGLQIRAQRADSAWMAEFFLLPSLCLPISIFGQSHCFSSKELLCFYMFCQLVFNCRKICHWLHRKKKLTIFPAPAGMSLAKLSPANYSRPGRVFLVTSRLGT